MAKTNQTLSTLKISSAYGLSLYLVVTQHCNIKLGLAKQAKYQALTFSIDEETHFHPLFFSSRSAGYPPCSEQRDTWQSEPPSEAARTPASSPCAALTRCPV